MVVAGIFGSFNWSEIDTSASLSTNGEQILTGKLLNVRNVWTIGGRLGVLVTPSTLAYGLVGWSWRDLDDVRVVSSELGLDEKFDEPTKQGITFGGGLEHKLSQMVSVFAEYRFTDVEDTHLVSNQFRIDGSSSTHQLRVGGALRLGTDDMAAATEPPPMINNWTGFYVGGGVGVDAFVRNTNIHTTDGEDSALDVALKGLGGGNVSGLVLAGYDQQISPRWLVGAFGNFNWGNEGFTVKFDIEDATASARLMTLDNSWTAGGRVGYILTDDNLVYVLAGFTRAQIQDLNFSFGTIDSPISRFVIKAPDFDGATVGVGFEKKISQHFALKAEYRYTNLGGDAAHGLVEETSVTVDIDPSIHSAFLTAVVRFP